jgi:nitrite reductase/ring-hydroxylating ferredoxin subunit
MAMFLHLRNKILLLFLVLLSPINSCDKDNMHPVPIVPVDFIINIESTQHIELNSIGGWANYTGGFRGIIIYRFSEDQFMAFDRACPVHPYDECARVSVTDIPLAADTCCNSTFLLIDGSPVSGPARHPLLQYRTFFNYPYLQVSN